MNSEPSTGHGRKKLGYFYRPGINTQGILLESEMMRKEVAVVTG
ncbi:hypothetical protein C900_04256 [Fulvivirga imtechensis AK7]|uniref:Uncharacterized protein n=1 Tax=Fulvivirga imtechensis AK7 TaxID=1237149 RepID=L8K0E1_9BACT|nr:hypothetical protein C900_04256 [Fulvivirga imtechensis AK7]